MKISAQQKKKNRLKIIGVAVDIMIDKGFKAATMRAIAKEASIGDATIYNYFPTKEAILFAYYEEKLNECVTRMRKIEKFNEFTLHEQLQTLFETLLELFLPDREFVALSFKRIFFALSQNAEQLHAIQDLFEKIVDDIFTAAIEVNEIPAQMFQQIIYHLLWDYYVGIIIFWLNDRSDQFADTSMMIDKTMDLFCSILKAGAVNKLFDIVSYFFKSHFLSRLEGMKRRMDTIKLIKREFMGG
ncbi:MAG: TetR family transcriptional regulator [Proteobacteria bacterium]|nr:TetR family transcriptional regulator [Pseudomonadota bacterium]